MCGGVCQNSGTRNNSRTEDHSGSNMLRAEQKFVLISLTFETGFNFSSSNCSQTRITTPALQSALPSFRKAFTFSSNYMDEFIRSVRQNKIFIKL